MPEGDTIHRTARTLGRIWTNATIERSAGSVAFAASLSGVRTRNVQARGKHLLIHLEDGSAIHSHMGMEGSWHVYRPGEAWRKPAFAAALHLTRPEIETVCFSPSVMELLGPMRLRQHPQLSRLGPDLLGESFDIDEALQRLLADPSLPLGVALMDQRRVAGIGNVYKSELCFIHRLDPFSPIGAFSTSTLAELLLYARELMQLNMHEVARTTRTRATAPATRMVLGDPRRGRHWVYERSGRDCYVCHTRIRVRRQSELGRTTYFCPRCQAGSDDERRR